MRDVKTNPSISRPDRVVFSQAILPLMAFLAAALSGFFSKGPLYLTDEASYLARAAVMAGFKSDMASSWFGGYSILLAPLFYLLSDPVAIWRGLCLLQSILFGLSFFFLERILRRIAGAWSERQIQNALVFTFLFPSFLVLTSYAFVTVLFIFLLTLCVYFCVESERAPAAILLCGAISGFLFWVHPVGIGAVAGLIVDRLIVTFIGKRNWYSIAAVIIAIALAGFYYFVVHDDLNGLMTAPGFPQYDHYKVTGQGVLQSLRDPHYLYGLVLVFLGQFSYFVIGTFGFTLAAVMFFVSKMRREGVVTSLQSFMRSDARALTLPIIGLGVAAGLTCLSFALPEIKRPDRLIFGRYSEVYLFPLMPFVYIAALAELQSMRRVTRGAVILMCLNAAALLPMLHLIDGISFDTISVVAFWPTYLFWGLPLPLLLIIGYAGSLLALRFGMRYGPLIILPIFACCLAGSMRNQIALSSWSTPTSFAKAVRSTMPKGSCIGVLWPDTETREGDLYEEQARYSFPLFDYHVRRVTSAQWAEQCKGPLLVPAYGREPIPPAARLIAYAADTKLSVYWPKERDPKLFISYLDPDEFSRIATDP